MKTRRGVQICRTGTFPLSTGMHTFTRAQFAAAIRNAEGRTAPRIGIGHTDKRWAALDASQDGDAALGRIENLRVEEDGNLLIGDLVDMPDWFADALPSSFPGRSLEGYCDDDDDLRITGVKVLGTKLPAVDTLEDLKALVSDEGPALVAAGTDNDGREIAVVFSPQTEESSVNRPPNIEQRQREGAKAVKAAVAEGKFSRERAPVYLEQYVRDPEGTRALLARMVAIDPQLLAATARSQEPSSERDLRHRTRVALGLEPAESPVAAAAPDAGLTRAGGSSSGPLEPSPSKPLGPTSKGIVAERATAPAGSPKPQLTRTEHGTVLYGGVVTRYSAERDGHEVFHDGDWLPIAEFERRGLTPADSNLAIVTTQQAGSAAARKRLNEGLNPAHALGIR
jgi:hypothetical protein